MTTTLLAIDDSKTMRKVLEITFSGDTYQVLVADSAQQALEKLRADKPTLALIDANLGSAGGGYDLCQQIKREAPGVGVLILSSKQQPYDKARGASVGADEFMDKPFDTQQILDKTAAPTVKVRCRGRIPARASAWHCGSSLSGSKASSARCAACCGWPSAPSAPVAST